MSTIVTRATSLAHAIEVLGDAPDTTVLAGGTDLMVYMQLGSATPT
ncbi:MAG: CO/xanthine dehydrogenase FAD-binding subunit, partial [Myxococcota bacterium]